MFYKLAVANAKKSIRNYLIYFLSLVVAVGSFYMILSIDTQDYFTLLQRFESQAVENLLMYIQAMYYFVLIVMFFLTFFANSFLLRQRKREFGLYLAFGMRRNRVFWILLLEGVFLGLVALAGGILVGIAVSELISVAILRLISIDLLGHSFNVSIPAIRKAAAGFGLIQLLAILLCSGRIFRDELIDLLQNRPKNKRMKMDRPIVTVLIFLLSCTALGLDYGYIISQSFEEIALNVISNPQGKYILLLILVSGTLSVFGLMYSIPKIRLLIGKKRDNTYFSGLTSFSFRQISSQFNARFKMLSLVSLLLFLSICLLSVGSSLAQSNTVQYVPMDVTVVNDSGHENIPDEIFQKESIRPSIRAIAPIHLLSVDVVDWDGAGGLDIDFTELYPDAKPADRDNQSMRTYHGFLDSALGDIWEIRVLRLSEYNNLLENVGKPVLSLEPGQTGIFSNASMMPGAEDAFQAAAATHPEIRMGDISLEVNPDIQIVNIVTDRLMNIHFALIVPDDTYDRLSEYPSSVEIYYNIDLEDEWVENQGVVEAPGIFFQMLNTESQKEGMELSYESSLSGVFRRLYIIISGCYTFMYLGGIFILMCGTMLSLVQISEQRDNRKRYRILAEIGASHGQMKKSVRAQVGQQFFLPLVLAVINGFVGARFLLNMVETNNVSTIPELLKGMWPVAAILVLIYGLYFSITLRAGYQTIRDVFSERRD